MNAHFDPNQYHPTFLGNEGHSDLFSHSMDSFLNRVHEWSLPVDVVEEATSNAWDFFHMTHAPLEIGEATYVSLGNPFTYLDDKLTISPEQLTSKGIHDLNSLSLIATHEIVHTITQSMYATGQITDWQSELIADKWMGIRAAMQGLDPTSVINSMQNEVDSSSHPGGDLRMRHIQEGYDMVQEMSDAGIPLNFDNLMNRAIAQVNSDSDVLPREQMAKIQMQTQAPENSFSAGFQQHGYSQEEIDHKIREQQSKIDYYNSLIADKAREVKSRTEAGLSSEAAQSAINCAKIDLENAIKEKNSWQSTVAS